MRTNSQDTPSTRNSASTKPSAGDSTMAAAVLLRPLHTIAAGPALASPAPTNPPIRACELDEGIPASQVTTFHTMAPGQRAENQPVVDDLRVDDAGADRVGDMQAKHGKGDEIEKGGPDHGVARLQHARGDDGGDGVGGVVQPVQKIEQQRHRDQREQRPDWRCP